ncbi:MAG TPA: sigma-70 family RNA polymerase sigma factor [Actinomycetes bacterium]|nr:sigma-70 family RNA polymerase sigma factor [Actinomycetes bacterium]
MDDDRLVELARAGDADAYELLVRRHQDVAWRTAYLIAGEAADAEDAAQEALVKAYAALPRFRAGAPFRPWLLAIVANEARNRRRAAGRRAGLALRVATEPVRHAPSPEAAAEAAEQRRMLLAALGRLRERDRLVIGCRYLLGLSEAESAQVLGLARGTVKSQLSRALGRLRALLAEPAAAAGGGGAR